MKSKPSSITAKWEASTPSKTQDNIVSCEQFRHCKPFLPIIEKAKETYMNWIMAGEYGRLWFEAHKKWAKENFDDKDKEEKNFISINRKLAVIKKPKPKKKNRL